MRRCISTATALAIFTFAAAPGCAHENSAAARASREERLPLMPPNGLPKDDPDLTLRFSRISKFDLLERELQEISAGRRKAPPWAKEWAGVYAHRQTGSVFAIGPTQAAESYGAWCLSPPEHRFGIVSDGSQDGVTIRWQSLDGKLSDPLRFVFVRWKGERYIADDKSITEMLNIYNRTGQVEFEWAKCRVPDPKPELPPAFSRGLHNGPIVLTVASIDLQRAVNDRPNSASTQLPIELGNGSDDGVYVGMDLACSVVPAGADLPPRPNADDSSVSEPETWIVIDHVEKHRSTGWFRFSTEAGQPPPPRAGDRLVTYRYE